VTSPASNNTLTLGESAGAATRGAVVRGSTRVAIPSAAVTRQADVGEIRITP
jgi:hypothetical protein